MSEKAFEQDIPDEGIEKKIDQEAPDKIVAVEEMSDEDLLDAEGVIVPEESEKTEDPVVSFSYDAETISAYGDVWGENESNGDGSPESEERQGELPEAMQMEVGGVVDMDSLAQFVEDEHMKRIIEEDEAAENDYENAVALDAAGQEIAERAEGGILEKMSTNEKRGWRAAVLGSVFAGLLSVAAPDAEAGGGGGGHDYDEKYHATYSQIYEKEMKKERVSQAKSDAAYDARSGAPMQLQRYSRAYELKAYQKAYNKEVKAEKKWSKKQQENMRESTKVIVKDVVKGKDWKKIKNKRAGDIVNLGFGILGGLINR